MNAGDPSALSDLIGPWSVLAVVLGLVVACVGHLGSQGRLRPQGSCFRFFRIAAGIMVLLAGFVYLVVLPASWAYSGPVPSATRHLADYDKGFAALIFLVFAVAFTFEEFRLRRAKR